MNLVGGHSIDDNLYLVMIADGNTRSYTVPIVRRQGERGVLGPALTMREGRLSRPVSRAARSTASWSPAMSGCRIGCGGDICGPFQKHKL
jgi:hypothetical protein